MNSRGDASVKATARFQAQAGSYYVRYYMRYQDGTARTWLRDNFYTMGEYGTASAQAPFEGFNFRTDALVSEARVTFEMYQERGTLNNRRDDTPNKTEEQAVFYDDIVIATERIGCRVAN